MGNLDTVIDEFLCYCDGESWNTDVKHINCGVQIKVSYCKQKANVNIYNTGTCLVQGAESKLKIQLCKYFEVNEKGSSKKVDNRQEDLF